MAKMQTYWVEGFGEFPADMLRYDEARFATERDEEIAADTHRRRRVMIQGRHCTHARWESFLWKVRNTAASPSRQTVPQRRFAASWRLPCRPERWS